VNLIDGITPETAEYTMLTTFPFDARFYSEHLSRELSDAGVATPVVLIDHDRYQENLQDGTWQPGSIGGGYYLEPVDVADVFHPKIAVSTSEDRISATVSSANLTLNEITSAAQLGATYTLDQEDADTDPLTPVVRDILELVSALRRDYVGRDAGTQLSRLVEAGSWINEVSAPDSQSTQFLSNLEKPILTQITSAIEGVERVRLAAPFFGSADSMADIIDKIDPANCELLIDEGTTHIDLPAVLDTIERPVAVRRLEYDRSRWIHAKWMDFQGPGWSGCFYGSPNMTGAALLSTAATGNLEAGILRIESDPGYFADGPPLSQNDNFPLTVSDPIEASALSTSSYADLDWSPDTERTALQLQDAYIESSTEDTAQLAVVVADTEAPSLRGTEAHLCGLTQESQFDVTWASAADTPDDVPANGVYGTAAVPTTWRAAIVQVALADGRQSTYRQVTSEPTPYTRPTHDMLSSGGREGVQTLIWNLIFHGDSRAGHSLSETATDLEALIGEPDAKPDDGGPGRRKVDTGGSGGQSAGSPHKQLQDSLELSKANLEHIIAQPHDPGRTQELVDHLENYWVGIESGYVRARITDQLSATSRTDFRLDTDGLLQTAREYYRELHSAELLKKVSDYLMEALRIAPEAHASYLDGGQAFECLFARPALVLALDAKSGGDGVPPFYFVQDVFEALSGSQPIIAERLLYPCLVKDHYAAVLEPYRDGLQQLAETYDCQLTFPERTTHAHKMLLYTVWYQELKRNPELFTEAVQSLRYPRQILEELGQMMLEGRNRLDNYDRLTEFTDGSLNAIAQKMFSEDSPEKTANRENKIEQLAQGDCW